MLWTATVRDTDFLEWKRAAGRGDGTGKDGKEDSQGGGSGTDSPVPQVRDGEEEGGTDGHNSDQEDEMDVGSAVDGTPTQTVSVRHMEHEDAV